MRIAYFISSHGFGHASRACAVMEAIWRQSPTAHFTLFTATPGWFFEHSLSQSVDVHDVATDLGLVQENSLQEDLSETLRQLRAWIPFPQPRIRELADAVGDAGSELVICDIAPLGLAVARDCQLPSVLIENFTWDWIYGAYSETEPDFQPSAEYLNRVFESAGHRIQTEPFCQPIPRATQVPPVSRRPRESRNDVRQRLEVPEDARLVMVTMGGIEWDYQGLEDALALVAHRDLSTHANRAGDANVWLLIPGGSPSPCRNGRVVLLPHRSEFFHPDLVHAADAVIGKLGYSTIAEVYRAGIPFGYVPRPTFPESPPLEIWVRSNLPCLRIDPQAFAAWQWLDDITPLLALPRRPAGTLDGDDAIADLVLSQLAERARSERCV